MKLMSLPYRKLRAIYTLLVQVDYLAGLCVAYMMGAGDWTMFFILLAASLILGLATVRIYVSMMESMMKEVQHDREKRSSSHFSV